MFNVSALSVIRQFLQNTRAGPFIPQTVHVLDDTAARPKTPTPPPNVRDSTGSLPTPTNPPAQTDLQREEAQLKYAISEYLFP